MDLFQGNVLEITGSWLFILMNTRRVADFSLYSTLILYFIKKVILGDFRNQFWTKTNNKKHWTMFFHGRPLGRASAWRGLGAMQSEEEFPYYDYTWCTKQPSLLHSNIERWFHQYKERHFEVLNAFNAIHTCHSALAYIASVTCNVTKIKLKMLILWIFPQFKVFSESEIWKIKTGRMTEYFTLLTAIMLEIKF